MTITLVLFYETAKYIPEFCESICQARVAASCDDIMTYDALALSCRMMTCSWCHKHVMEDLFRPMQCPSSHIPSCLWMRLTFWFVKGRTEILRIWHLFQIDSAIPAWGWAMDETPLWRHREHVVVRPVAGHCWRALAADAVLAAACSTLSEESREPGHHRRFFFFFYKIYDYLTYGLVGLYYFRLAYVYYYSLSA